ncbi:MAG: prolipoprotein diacylglyceryl transferase [Oscillospiraceae bacterium]|nr:prolipoprotein diacylglyceryl transferase [Oscillospiraceae bacterium]
MNLIEFPGLGGLKFNISETIFTIGGFSLRWYAVLILLGILLAGVYAFKNSRRFGLDFDRVLDVVLGGIIGAIIGARLYYVVFSPGEFLKNPMSIFYLWNGGLAIYGGIIGAFLAGFFVCKWRKVPVLPMFDLAGIGFLIGQAIGRWGNFFNVEAFGSNTSLPWGMISDKTSSHLLANFEKLRDLGMDIYPYEAVHPTFLYESLWCALGFLLLHFLSKRRRYDGQIFLMYIGFYGLGRLFIEGLRTDSLLIGFLRISQVVAGLLLITSIVIMLLIKSRIAQERNDEYLPLYVNTPECAKYFEELKNKENKADRVEDNITEDESNINEDEPKNEKDVIDEFKHEDENQDDSTEERDDLDESQNN